MPTWLPPDDGALGALTWLACLGLAMALAALLAAVEVAFLAAWAPDLGEALGPGGGKTEPGRPLSLRRRVWDTERLGRLVAVLRLVRGGLQATTAGAAGCWMGAHGGLVAALVAALLTGWVGRGMSIAPVLAAKRHRRALVAALTPAAQLLLIAAWPLHAAWAWVQRKVAAALGQPPAGAYLFWTPKELAAIGDQAHADTLGGRGSDLFRTLVDFRGTVVREIMVPRTAMIALSQGVDADAVRALLLEAGHSRVPVYDDTIDNVVGLLHVKDLLAAQWRHGLSSQVPSAGWAALVRPTFWVPEGMKISELLREFQRRKTHMAIVVDEYGGTSGVVTLEDIIEEIVGEIHDEYDVDEKQYRRMGDKVVADGRVSVWDLEEPLGVHFRPIDGSYETLAGFLTSRLGTMPQRGMQVVHAGWTFVVKEASAKRVEVVEIFLTPPPARP